MENVFNTPSILSISGLVCFLLTKGLINLSNFGVFSLTLVFRDAVVCKPLIPLIGLVFLSETTYKSLSELSIVTLETAFLVILICLFMPEHYL